MVYRQIPHPRIFQKLQPVFFLEHGNGRAISRHDSKRCHDADRAPVIDRHGGLRMQHMAVALAVGLEIAHIVAAGGQAAAA